MNIQSKMGRAAWLVGSLFAVAALEGCMVPTVDSAEADDSAETEAAVVEGSEAIDVNTARSSAVEGVSLSTLLDRARSGGLATGTHHGKFHAPPAGAGELLRPLVDPSTTSQEIAKPQGQDISSEPPPIPWKDPRVKQSL